MQSFLNTWVGRAAAIAALAAGLFSWVWFVVHGQIDPGIFQSIFSVILGGLGVHFIKGGSGTASGPTPPTATPAG